MLNRHFRLSEIILDPATEEPRPRQVWNHVVAPGQSAQRPLRGRRVLGRGRNRSNRARSCRPCPTVPPAGPAAPSYRSEQESGHTSCCQLWLGLRFVYSLIAPERRPMKCSKCGHENRSGAKFCEECTAPFPRTCPNCGSQVSPTAKFCTECAHPVGAAPESPPSRPATSPQSYTPKHLAEKILTSKSALEGERKQVTVLFADLKGSMELLADRDPEEARKLLDPVLEIMMRASPPPRIS